MGMFEERDVTGVKSYRGPGKNKTVSGTCRQAGYPTVGGVSGSGVSGASRGTVDGVARPSGVVSGMRKQKFAGD